MAFITVGDLKTQGNITGGVDDAELADFVEAACGVVEDLAGPIEQRTVTAEVVNQDSTNIALSEAPVVSITSVALAQGGATFDPALFTLNKATGVAYRTDSSSLPGQMVVTYVVGYAVAPAWARMAAKIIAVHLAATQRGTRSLRAADGSPVPVGGYLIPNQAAELLERHMRLPGVA